VEELLFANRPHQIPTLNGLAVPSDWFSGYNNIGRDGKLLGKTRTSLFLPSQRIAVVNRLLLEEKKNKELTYHACPNYDSQFITF
jgi:hypothetical protein